MDEAEPVTRLGGWRLDPAAFSWRFSRSSGAGGQHVNTTDSKAELICDVTRLGLPEHVAERVRAKLGDEVRIVASTERSQRRNRADALGRLGELVDGAARVRGRRPADAAGQGAVERRIAAKKHVAGA